MRGLRVPESEIAKGYVGGKDARALARIRSPQSTLILEMTAPAGFSATPSPWVPRIADWSCARPHKLVRNWVNPDIHIYTGLHRFVLYKNCIRQAS